MLILVSAVAAISILLGLFWRSTRVASKDSSGPRKFGPPLEEVRKMYPALSADQAIELAMQHPLPGNDTVDLSSAKEFAFGFHFEIRRDRKSASVIGTSCSLIVDRADRDVYELGAVMSSPEAYEMEWRETQFSPFALPRVRGDVSEVVGRFPPFLVQEAIVLAKRQILPGTHLRPGFYREYPFGFVFQVMPHSRDGTSFVVVDRATRSAMILSNPKAIRKFESDWRSAYLRE